MIEWAEGSEVRGIRERASELGRKMRAEDGVGRAVGEIEKWVAVETRRMKERIKEEPKKNWSRYWVGAGLLDILNTVSFLRPGKASIFL